MPLPSDPLAKWPPAENSRELQKYAEWSAWYSGDPERLIDVYAGIGTSQTPDAMVQNQVPWWRFWSRMRKANWSSSQQRANLHVPLAGDLASVSSAILFSEEPRIVLPDAHKDNPDATAKSTEERLLELIEDGGVYNRLIEAAETCAAMGGVYMYPAWDKEISSTPFIAVAQVDQAIPKFRYGLLWSVLFWREVKVDGQVRVRHLESHEIISGQAHILHGLYRGTLGTIGDQVPLDQDPATAMLEPDITLPFKELDVEYIPNMRPNRLWRTSPLGASDYSGSEGLFDALDEVYASWMRDVRLGKARLVVPTEYLTIVQGRTSDGATFDVDHEVFSPLNMEPAAAQQGAKSIEQVQFDIRVQDHLDTALELIERCVSNAGYSPQTFGLHIVGRAESGTALRIRENRTFLTQKRKGHWWRPALERLFMHLVAIDKVEFNTAGLDPSQEIDVELVDGWSNDQIELANTTNILFQAQAASIEVRVKRIHPEWTQEQVMAEVDKIKEEFQVGVAPAVVGGSGPVSPEAIGAGVGAGAGPEGAGMPGGPGPGPTSMPPFPGMPMPAMPGPGATS